MRIPKDLQRLREVLLNVHPDSQVDDMRQTVYERTFDETIQSGGTSDGILTAIRNIFHAIKDNGLEENCNVINHCLVSLDNAYPPCEVEILSSIIKIAEIEPQLIIGLAEGVIVTLFNIFRDSNQDILLLRALTQEGIVSLLSKAKTTQQGQDTLSNVVSTFIAHTLFEKERIPRLFLFRKKCASILLPSSKIIEALEMPDKEIDCFQRNIEVNLFTELVKCISVKLHITSSLDFQLYMTTHPDASTKIWRQLQRWAQQYPQLA